MGVSSGGIQTSSWVSRKLQEDLIYDYILEKASTEPPLRFHMNEMQRGTVTIIGNLKMLPVCLFRCTVMVWFTLESLCPLIKHVLFYFSLWLCHFMQKIVASTRLIRFHRNGYAQLSSVKEYHLAEPGSEHFMLLKLPCGTVPLRVD